MPFTDKPPQGDRIDASDQEPGLRLLRALVNELLRRLEVPDEAKAMSAAEMELVRKLCADNSVTLAQVRRGDFGEVAKRAAEEFPYPVGAQVAGNA